MTKKTAVLKIDLLRSYLATIAGSPGTRMFRHFWCSDNGQPHDILRNGELSCANFVSAVLYQHKLIADMHSTVQGTVADMKKSGWRRLRKVRPGAVVLWKPQLYPNGEVHSHLGFALDNQIAISNSAVKRVPVRHHLTYGTRGSHNYRPIISIWWHPKLNGSK